MRALLVVGLTIACSKPDRPPPAFTVDARWDGVPCAQRLGITVTSEALVSGIEAAGVRTNEAFVWLEDAQVKDSSVPLKITIRGRAYDATATVPPRATRLRAPKGAQDSPMTLTLEGEATTGTQQVPARFDGDTLVTTFETCGATPKVTASLGELTQEGATVELRIPTAALVAQLPANVEDRVTTLAPVALTVDGAGTASIALGFEPRVLITAWISPVPARGVTGATPYTKAPTPLFLRVREGVVDEDAFRSFSLDRKPVTAATIVVYQGAATWEKTAKTCAYASFDGKTRESVGLQRERAEVIAYELATGRELGRTTLVADTACDHARREQQGDVQNRVDISQVRQFLRGLK